MMRKAIVTGLAVAGLVLLAGTWSRKSTAEAASEGTKGDREAIEQSARAFTQAYNQADAAALAALWTPQAEMRDAGGRVITGRAAIEATFRTLFKEPPRSTIEVLIKSIRFPAKDLAVEEGLLRQSRGAKELPVTTSYVVIHVREGGQWKMALASESSSGQDRIEDLDWLLGDWTTKVKDATVRMSFSHDAKKPVVMGTFTRAAPGKESVPGTIRIAFDPETGRLHSWSFEDDGAHSQSVWLNDGKSWILDSRGVLADGTPTAERIVLQRVGPDVITWRAIDRVLGDTQLGDTPPMRLTRVSGKR